MCPWFDRIQYENNNREQSVHTPNNKINNKKDVPKNYQQNRTNNKDVMLFRIDSLGVQTKISLYNI